MNVILFFWRTCLLTELPVFPSSLSLAADFIYPISHVWVIRLAIPTIHLISQKFSFKNQTVLTTQNTSNGCKGRRCVKIYISLASATANSIRGISLLEELTSVKYKHHSSSLSQAHLPPFWKLIKYNESFSHYSVCPSGPPLQAHTN